jgi:hypothetical protein
MLKTTVEWITPDANTLYLVGAEGLVWTQPAIGEAFTLAARNADEQRAAAVFVANLLELGLIPYGMPLNQRVIVAMFGGNALRDCQWVHHANAPQPTGDADAQLPKRAAVIKLLE